MKIAPLISLSLTLPAIAHAADWPRWLGPDGDSTWRESGVITQIPETGLKTKWETDVGLGYSGPAVANGSVYVMDYLLESGEIANNAGAPDALAGVERVSSFNAATGELNWQHSYPRDYLVSYGSGPRSTPTVAGGKVYTLGAEGDLNCFEADTGRIIWSKRFATDYGADTPIWGHAAHPLVYQNFLYCIVGGDGSVVVALDKDTGEERWRALTAGKQGYCAPSIITHNGIEQLVIWHPESVNGLNPYTGKVYWSEPLTPDWGGSIQVPRKQGDLLFVGGPGTATMFRLATRDGTPAVERVWQGNPRNAVYPVNSTVVFTQEALYSVDSGTGALVAVNPSDGSRFWETAEPVLKDPSRRGRHGTAFPVYHPVSGTYFIVNETGDLVLAKLSPEGYREIGRARVIEPTNSTNAGGTREVVWSHPALANKTLFVRNDEKLVAIDLDVASYQ